jgi:hypothetical protein
MTRAAPHEVSSAIAMIALSPIEEDFFRAGDALSDQHDFSDLDEGFQPTTLWRVFVEWIRGERPRYAE